MMFASKRSLATGDGAAERDGSTSRATAFSTPMVDKARIWEELPPNPARQSK